MPIESTTSPKNNAPTELPQSFDFYNDNKTVPQEDQDVQFFNKYVVKSPYSRLFDESHQMYLKKQPSIATDYRLPPHPASKRGPVKRKANPLDCYQNASIYNRMKQNTQRTKADSQEKSHKKLKEQYSMYYGGAPNTVRSPMGLSRTQTNLIKNASKIAATTGFPTSRRVSHYQTKTPANSIPMHTQ